MFSLRRLVCLVFLCFLHTCSSSAADWPECGTESSDPTNPDSCNVPVCPDCSLVDCLPELTPDDCPAGTTLRQNIVKGGCCPACVKYLDIGDPCIPPENQLGSKPSYKAAEMLSRFNGRPLPCSSKPSFEYVTSARFVSSARRPDLSVPLVSIYGCVGDLGGFFYDYEGYPSCVEDKCDFQTGFTACLDGLMLYNEFKEAEKCSDGSFDDEWQWERRCHPYTYDFLPVQTKTNKYQPKSNRYCYSTDGKRIFGAQKADAYANADDNEAEITCKCSRKYDELTRKINGFRNDEVHDVTLHCTPRGDYEPLQCDQGRCWCADTRTGTPLTSATHINFAYLLPCALTGSFGAQYLRRCESQAVNREHARRRLRKHGLSWPDDANVQCSPDGSFGLVTCDDESTRCSCVDQNQNIIANYQIVDSQKLKMKCRCARDRLDGLSSLKCDDLGNYEELQSSSGVEFCVDDSGFQKTGTYEVELDEKPCRIPKCSARVCPKDQAICRECVALEC